MLWLDNDSVKLNCTVMTFLVECHVLVNAPLILCVTFTYLNIYIYTSNHSML